MSWFSDFLDKIFPIYDAGPVKSVEPTAPEVDTKEVPAESVPDVAVFGLEESLPEEVKLVKKKVPTRAEVAKLILAFTTGAIPTRIGPYKKVKETHGKNRSPAIDSMLKAQGGSLADPYCQAGVQEMLDEKCRYYGVSRKKVNIPEGVGTQTVWNKTPAKYKSKKPLLATWVNWRHGDTWKGHTGEVVGYLEGAKTFMAAEFNTTAAGQKVERDGEGYYYGLTRNLAGDGDMKINGFIDVYQAMVDAMIESGDWEV